MEKPVTVEQLQQLLVRTSSNGDKFERIGSSKVKMKSRLFSVCPDTILLTRLDFCEKDSSLSLLSRDTAFESRSTG